MEGIEKQT